MESVAHEHGAATIAAILSSQDFNSLKSAIARYITAAEEIKDKNNGMNLWKLCHDFSSGIGAWAKQYDQLPRGAKYNALVVQPEHSPLMMLKSFVPLNGSPLEVLDALQQFNNRCDEFVPPESEAISGSEINKVLNAAQKTYRLIEIIAPDKPMKILRLNYSHAVYSSQCGLYDNPSNPATIMVYHPHASTIYNRVYIFAHELGHAFHKAITCDVNITPKGFNELNERVAAKFTSTEDMQESFADAIALAILNVRGLGTHFPTQFSKHIAPMFSRYLHELCEDYFRKERA